MDASYLVLSGGVGGAKMVRGLQQILAANRITVIANTGDDFEHLGLPIAPDIDTLMYTLAGVANPVAGWGLADESWSFMSAVEALGGDTWFQLGDRDLATHVRRREFLGNGLSLSEATEQLCRHLGVDIPVVPMSDQKVRTELDTDAGILAFQDYFVRLHAEPAVRQIHYTGSSEAKPGQGLAGAFRARDLGGIIISPSNPWLSIDPILSIPALKTMIVNSEVPVVAVSPIVGGRAIKGPTAKLMLELGVEVSAVGIATHYKGLIDALIIDPCDAQHADDIHRMGIQTGIAPTIMNNDADKSALAAYVVDFIATLDNE